MLSMVDALPALDPSLLDLASAALTGTAEVQDLLTPLADETLDAMDTLMSAQSSVSELVRSANHPLLPPNLSPSQRGERRVQLCGGLLTLYSGQEVYVWPHSCGIRIGTSVPHAPPGWVRRHYVKHLPLIAHTFPFRTKPSHHQRRAFRVAREGAPAPLSYRLP
jgi:hypothetical protein